jgi:transcriptional regulator with XRE-family HTH domain
MDINNTPLPVKRALKRLGENLRDARKRRRIPMRLAAERASVSRSTLSKIEKGDEGVSLGAYAKILFILGMIQKLAELADPKFDELGMDLESERLPKRIRIPRKEKRDGFCL